MDSKIYLRHSYGKPGECMEKVQNHELVANPAGVVFKTDEKQALAKSVEEQLADAKKTIKSLEVQLEITLNSKVVAPLTEDQVLVVMVRDTNAMGHFEKMVKRMREIPSYEKVVFPVDGSIADVMVCTRDQIAYTRDKRVIIRPRHAPDAPDE